MHFLVNNLFILPFTMNQRRERSHSIDLLVDKLHEKQNEIINLKDINNQLLRRIRHLTNVNELQKNIIKAYRENEVIDLTEDVQNDLIFLDFLDKDD